MFLKKLSSKTLRPCFPTSKNPILHLTDVKLLNPPPYAYTQVQNYVDVYQKWKKDRYFDSIEHIHSSLELKRIVSLKTVIAQSPDGCIPISEISKRGFEFDIKIKVARYLRQHPSVFEEFTGPLYNLPWFRLTQQAAEIDMEERRVFEDCKEDLRGRLKKLVLMSKEKMLPVKIIKGLLWYLGLPEDFLDHPSENLDSCFRFVELGDGEMGLKVESEEKILSVLQKNAMRKGVYNGEPMEGLELPMFPSKGVRLRKKIEDWLNEFQKVPYVSPYEDFSHLDTDSDIAEKRLIGFLHELLCLFVEHSVERRKLLFMKKYFGLPQKVHKAFERHPNIFYLSLRSKTCTAILKEAYCDKMAIEGHPMLRIRNKYLNLVKGSDVILRRRRVNNRPVEREELDLDDAAEEDCIELV